MRIKGVCFHSTVTLDIFFNRCLHESEGETKIDFRYGGCCCVCSYKWRHIACSVCGHIYDLYTFHHSFSVNIELDCPQNIFVIHFRFCFVLISPFGFAFSFLFAGRRWGGGCFLNFFGGSVLTASSFHPPTRFLTLIFTNVCSIGLVFVNIHHAYVMFLSFSLPSVFVFVFAYVSCLFVFVLCLREGWGVSELPWYQKVTFLWP